MKYSGDVVGMVTGEAKRRTPTNRWSFDIQETAKARSSAQMTGKSSRSNNAGQGKPPQPQQRAQRSEAGNGNGPLDLARRIVEAAERKKVQAAAMPLTERSRVPTARRRSVGDDPFSIKPNSADAAASRADVSGAGMLPVAEPPYPTPGLPLASTLAAIYESMASNPPSASSSLHPAPTSAMKPIHSMGPSGWRLAASQQGNKAERGTGASEGGEVGEAGARATSSTLDFRIAGRGLNSGRPASGWWDDEVPLEPSKDAGELRRYGELTSDPRASTQKQPVIMAPTSLPPNWRMQAQKPPWPLREPTPVIPSPAPSPEPMVLPDQFSVAPSLASDDENLQRWEQQFLQINEAMQMHQQRFAQLQQDTVSKEMGMPAKGQDTNNGCHSLDLVESVQEKDECLEPQEQSSWKQQRQEEEVTEPQEQQSLPDALEIPSSDSKCTALGESDELFTRVDNKEQQIEKRHSVLRLTERAKSKPSVQQKSSRHSGRASVEDPRPGSAMATCSVAKEDKPVVIRKGAGKENSKAKKSKSASLPFDWEDDDPRLGHIAAAEGGNMFAEFLAPYEDEHVRQQVKKMIHDR